MHIEKARLTEALQKGLAPRDKTRTTGVHQNRDLDILRIWFHLGNNVLHTLMRRLEEQPSVHVCLFVIARHEESFLRIVSTREVLCNRITLPHSSVIVPVVDDDRKTSVGGQTEEPLLFVLLLAKVEHMFPIITHFRRKRCMRAFRVLVGKVELVEQNQDLPPVDTGFVEIEGELRRRFGGHCLEKKILMST